MNGVVIALGEFDAIHMGHKRLLNQTVAMAKACGAKPAALTFDGDLGAYFEKNTGVVYTREERVEKFKALGIQTLFTAPVTREFLGKKKEDFLFWLNAQAVIKGYVCGEDFTFGKNAEGNIDDLKSFAAGHGQSVTAVKTVFYGDKKISSTLIKHMLAQGDLAAVNEMLGENFFILGAVKKGRGDGRKLGIPTVNVTVSHNKAMPKFGVYGGSVTARNKTYPAVINYGPSPTFSFSDPVLEAHLLGFDGDLYGETVRVEFKTFIREIRAFSTTEELGKQIAEDMKKV